MTFTQFRFWYIRIWEKLLKNIENFPEFSIGYNTEGFCEKAPKISEERWNYAFWSQNNQVILSADNNEMARAFCSANGIKKPSSSQVTFRW